MGTRGFVGVYVDGQTKGIYNHFDSYLQGLGLSTATDISLIAEKYPNINFEEKARDWIAVDEDTKPTKEQIKEYKKHSDLSVSSRSYEDWYCLLRNLQGEIVQHLAEVRHYFDSKNFLDDSLFCEWAYIWNLDDNLFEVYKGFQKRRHRKGRYAKNKPNENGYYPVALIHRFDINEHLVSNFNKYVERYKKKLQES